MKQHLAPGSDGALLQVAEDLVGLHGTSPTTPYLSLHARLPAFSRADLDRALYDERSLIRLKAMRGTVFLLTHGLATMAYAATRGTIVARDRRYLALAQADYDVLTPAIFDALAGRALSTADLRAEVAADGDLAAVIGILTDEGRIVRDRPTGSWRSAAFRYRRWDEVLPGLNLAALSEEDGVRRLVRRYVAAYGPVTRGDILWWTGLPVRLVQRAIDQLHADLVDVRITGAAASYLMTAEDLAAMEGGVAFTGEIVTLLPMLDPLTMSYKERDHHLDPRYRDLVVDRGGNATSTILLDGAVRGVWDISEQPSPAVRVLWFEDRHRAPQAVLERAAAIGQFWYGGSVPVVEHTDMVPLTRRSGVMRKPLDEAARAQRPDGEGLS